MAWIKSYSIGTLALAYATIVATLGTWLNQWGWGRHILCPLDPKGGCFPGVPRPLWGELDDVSASEEHAGDGLDTRNVVLAWHSLLFLHTGLVLVSGIWQGHSLWRAFALLSSPGNTLSGSWVHQSSHHLNLNSLVSLSEQTSLSSSIIRAPSYENCLTR